MLYSERNSSITVIQLPAEGGPVPLATGFFISSGGRVFLATCHHVVSWAGGYPPAVILKLRPRGGGGLRDYKLELIDAGGRRRWRTFLLPENVWDVAVVELDPKDLLPFDVRPWREEECPPAGESLTPGAEITVLTYPETYGPEPAPYDARTRVCAEEHNMSAGDKSVFITKPLYHGASGSPVYRIMGAAGAAGAEAEIQLVGVFTGAWPQDKPLVGHFHYAETVSARSWRRQRTAWTKAVVTSACEMYSARRGPHSRRRLNAATCPLGAATFAQSIETAMSSAKVFADFKDVARMLMTTLPFLSIR